uniref:Uncharacterized protein n=1 Tax=Cyanistes caeruleus TaxID=156563 RepID=A0A8C0U1F1_CYACU
MVPKGAPGLEVRLPQQGAEWDNPLDVTVSMLSLRPQDNPLAVTVSMLSLRPQDNPLAIHAILVYSQNVEELLRRRKVYREIIFKYLASQGIAVPPSSEKHLLIERVRQLWSGQLMARASEPGHRKPAAQVSAAAGNPQGAQRHGDHSIFGRMPN